MKQRWIWLITVLVLASLLGGCGVLLGNYVSVEPHNEEDSHIDPNMMSVYSYKELQNALISLVEDGVQRKVILVPTIQETNIQYYVEAAITYTAEKNAIGAYFVDEIRYELGSNAGVPALVIDISYKKELTEILRLNRVRDMDGAMTAVAEALNDCKSGAVFLVENYQQVDFDSLIRQYMHMYPQRIVEIPQTTVSIYPEVGDERIVELSFQYDREQTELLSMQNLVRTMFTSAQLYVEGAASDSERFSRLYAFLMERNDYTFRTTDAPAYYLLSGGVGDSEAFACVYAAMCRQTGLDCRMITGTKNGEPWTWNTLTVDGVTYYIDLISCYQGNGFCIMNEQEMDGYIWNSQDNT